MEKLPFLETKKVLLCISSHLSFSFIWFSSVLEKQLSYYMRKSCLTHSSFSVNVLQILLQFSESERAERERKGDLDQFERLDGDRNQTSEFLAVKKVMLKETAFLYDLFVIKNDGYAYIYYYSTIGQLREKQVW